MTEKKQISTVWAFLLGILWPGASLLCIGKTKQALIIGFLLVFYSFFLSYMPIRFIILSLYLYVLVHVILLAYGLISGLLEARKPCSPNPIQSMAGYVFFYLLFMLSTISLLISTPISFYKVQQDFEHVYTGDMLVLQEKVPLIGHFYNDSIIFYTDNFDERLGVVKAVTGDILEFNNGTLFRNGEELAKIADFPIKKFIVPDNLILVQHDKEKDIRVSKTEQFETKDTKSLTFLTAHRIKGKALFVFFSSNLNNIGKRLVFATVAR